MEDTSCIKKTKKEDFSANPLFLLLFSHLSFLSDEALNLFLRSIGQDFLELIDNSLERFLWRTFTLTGLFPIQLLRSVQQRPAPAVFPVVLVARIDEVLRHDVRRHFQTGDVAVELRAHPFAVEAASRPQLAGDEAAACPQRVKDCALDGICVSVGELAASVVAEVRPPIPTYEARLLVEELTVHAGHLGHNLPLPLPQRPIPASIGEVHIAAVLIHNLFCGITVDAAVEQRHEADFINKLHHFYDGAYTWKLHDEP